MYFFQMFLVFYPNQTYEFKTAGSLKTSDMNKLKEPRGDLKEIE